MRVLVTGGTGLVGSHSAAALGAAGHDVRLLVRDPARVEPALAPLGHTAVETMTGDVTDEAAVERALDGCDAVLHAAAVVATDRRRADEVLQTNVRGAELVLRGAQRRDLDPILYVSSVSALFDPRLDVLTPDSPVADATTAYGQSKAVAERLARALQADNAPVVCTYPGGVMGPHDPKLGEPARAIVTMMRWGAVPITSGGFPIVDVRDVAAAHAAAMTPGRGPRRYLLGGHFLPLPQLADALERVSGRRMLHAPSPGPMLRGVGRLVDAAKRVVPFEHSMNHEGMVFLTQGVPTDDSGTFEELGIRLRPVDETLRDTLRWLHETGQLTAKQAGEAAAAT